MKLLIKNHARSSRFSESRSDFQHFRMSVLRTADSIGIPENQTSSETGRKTHIRCLSIENGRREDIESKASSSQTDHHARRCSSLQIHSSLEGRGYIPFSHESSSIRCSPRLYANRVQVADIKSQPTAGRHD